MVFLPFLSQSSQNPWKFLCKRDIKVPITMCMTFGKHLRMGASRQQCQPSNQRNFGTFGPIPWPPGRGEGLEIESVTSGQWFSAYVMKPLQNPRRMRFRELLGLWAHGGVRRVDNLERTRKDLGPIAIPCPMPLFCLAVPELYPFTINQWSRNMFFWVLWATLAR